MILRGTYEFIEVATENLGLRESEQLLKGRIARHNQVINISSNHSNWANIHQRLEILLLAVGFPVQPGIVAGDGGLFLPCLLQSLYGLFALSDITDVACEHGWPIQRNTGDGELDGKLGPICMECRDLDPLTNHSTFTGGKIRRQASPVVFSQRRGYDESGQFLVEYLSAVIPKHLLCRWIEFEDSSTLIHSNDGIECCLQDRSFAYLTYLHGLYQPLLLSSIAQDDQATDEGTAAMVQGRNTQVKGARHRTHCQDHLFMCFHDPGIAFHLLGPV